MTRRSPLLLAMTAGLAPALGQTCNFAPPITFAVPPTAFGGAANPSYIAAGDIDNDGDIDLVTDSNGPGNDPTQVFWNDGSGALSIGPSLTAGWGTGEVAVLDFDGDGDLEVVRCNYFDNGAFFFRNASGTIFDPGFYYSGGGGCIGVAAADIDGDTDPDFVLTDHFGGQLRPYRNIAGLGFNSVGLFAAGAAPYAIASGDMDNDGDIDLITADDDGHTITIMFNDGSGLFPLRQSYPMGRARDIAIADFNTDGFLDVVATDFFDEFGQLGDEVSVRLGMGAGLLGARVKYRTQLLPEAVGVADFDSDGALDLAVTCSADDSVVVLAGHGDGTFAPFEAFDASADPRGIALGDFDGDGDTDIATVSNQNSRLAIIMNECGSPTEPDDLELVWHASYDNLFNEDIPSHLAIAADGTIVAGGSTYFSANENDFSIVAFAPDGSPLWNQAYNGTGDHYDGMADMTLSPTGEVCVTGESWNNDFGVHWATLRYAPDGAPAWARIYGAANTFSQQRPAAIAADGQGRTAVAGYYINGAFQAKFAVAVYDAAGALLWDAKVPLADGAPNLGQARDVAFDTSGNVYAVGNIDDADDFGEEAFIVKLDAAGSVIWTRRHDAATSSTFHETYATGIYPATDGGVYVLIEANRASTGFDPGLVKYDANGALQWSHMVSAFGASTSGGITPMPDGSIVISARSSAGVALFAYSPGGDLLWQIDTPDTASFSGLGRRVTVGRDGQVYVLHGAGSDIAISRIDPEVGQVQGVTAFDSGSSNDFPAAIAAAPDGSVVALAQHQPSILHRRDFSVFKVQRPRPACRPDLNGDGQVNTNDFFLFLSLYQAQDQRADFATGDGVNTNDFFAFLAAYQAGC